MQSETDIQLTIAARSASEVPVILLVEDEDDVREITAQVLASGGYRVLQAAGPAEALHLAAEHPGPIDLLLTDVVMPERNGVELAEQVRRLRPRLIAIFMSGYAQTEVFRKGSARSAMHIQKPFTVRSLLARIAQALEASRALEVSGQNASSAAACAAQASSRAPARQGPVVPGAD